MKSIIPVILLMFLFSCSQDDINSPTPIIELVAETSNVTYYSDGSSHQEHAIFRLVNFEEFSGDSVEFTISIDEQNSTAIDGVHYNFTPNTNTYTLNIDNNFIQSIPIEILSEDDDASHTKEIAFVAQEVGSDIETQGLFTINYECFVDLTGTYTVANDACGILTNPFTQTITITQTEQGKWHLSSGDGLWAWKCTLLDFQYNWGNIEVKNCNNILYSDDLFWNTGVSWDIGTILGGTWNQQTGVLEMRHSQNYFTWAPTTWTSRYVRQ